MPAALMALRTVARPAVVKFASVRPVMSNASSVVVKLVGELVFQAMTSSAVMSSKLVLMVLVKTILSVPTSNCEIVSYPVTAPAEAPSVVPL